MARQNATPDDYVRPIRRLLVGLLVFVLLAFFLLWRIDSPRVERFRAMVIDAVVPNFTWLMAPVEWASRTVSDFQSYQQLAEQNRALRREVQQLEAWREAAVRLEQQNAQLRDLNQVQLDPQLTYITGEVMVDSGLSLQSVGAAERGGARRHY